jgi:lipid II:glycine glycyltransferase (peptidoglycan interpeptide bridge formation enzyme)
VRLFTVRDQGMLIGAGVFFISPPFMHYHLSGSRAEDRHKAPNNLMLHTAAEWGAAHGCEILHLGGGTSSSPDDPLFRFKTEISAQTASFYLGSRVHLPDAYQHLCDLWLAQMNAPRPPYFLLYRAEVERD